MKYKNNHLTNTNYYKLNKIMTDKIFSIVKEELLAFLNPLSGIYTNPVGIKDN